jgi:alkanesulfonate monooxygenase SsuD/methylene tetrahydromethanopterin reductase-like flavin-dependent oxidoreductase (luciferase family)
VAISFAALIGPMHDPVLVAKQVATLDVISGGRVSLGLAVGAREEDYRAIGAHWDDKLLARLDAFVATIRRVWTGEHVVEGAGQRVGPLPVQKGGPEILAAVLMPQATRRAARWADGISSFSFGPTREDVGARFDLARAAWREAGRDRAPRLVTGFWFALGPKAREQLETYLARYLAFMGRGRRPAVGGAHDGDVCHVAERCREDDRRPRRGRVAARAHDLGSRRGRPRRRPARLTPHGIAFQDAAGNVNRNLLP